MTERDEREDDAVSAESDELIRAHAELKKLVRTGEDLLYWNHTAGQRPLTRDERKERREARRGNVEPLSPIWHDTDLDPRADITESHAAGRGPANPSAGEQETAGGVKDPAFDSVPTEPIDREEARAGLDETPTRVLEPAIDPPPSGLWQRLRRARVTVAAAVITIVLGGLIAFLAPGSRQRAPSAPRAPAVEATAHRVAPTGVAPSPPPGAQAREPAAARPVMAPSVPDPTVAAATAAGTTAPLGTTVSAVSPKRAPIGALSGSESGAMAPSNASVDRVLRGSPRRPAQAPRGTRPPSSARPDLPGSADLAAPDTPPTVSPPAEHDSAGNPDYELLVPEIRRP